MQNEQIDYSKPMTPPSFVPKCPKSPLVERVFVVKLKEGKPIKDITDLIGGRIWTLDGVEGGVTVTEIL